MYRIMLSWMESATVHCVLGRTRYFFFLRDDSGLIATSVLLKLGNLERNVDQWLERLLSRLVEHFGIKLLNVEANCCTVRTSSG